MNRVKTEPIIEQKSAEWQGVSIARLQEVLMTSAAKFEESAYHWRQSIEENVLYPDVLENPDVIADRISEVAQVIKQKLVDNKTYSSN